MKLKKYKKIPYASERSEQLWRNHRRSWVGLLILLFLSTSLISQNATHLQLSLLTIPEHAPFDGTVSPLQEVPNWLKLMQDNDEILYNQLSTEQKVTLPTYDKSRLSIPAENLQWGDPYDNETRQMQLTYSVPYAGSYRMYSAEGDGSHPGIDIRAPEGTPIYAIANGVVERVSYSSYGFGNLIVIRHNNVPSLEDPQVKTTIFSGYGHLSTIDITEGEVVTKGQKIGEVGSTGTATTNHIHFQIDNELAPWHLYWPFNTEEANAVGGFFSAINEGVGKENVYQYTIHSMDYVQEYLDGTPVYAAAEESPKNIEEVQLEVKEPQLEVKEIQTESEPEEESGFSKLNIDYEEGMLLQSDQILKVHLLNGDNQSLTNTSFNGTIEVTVEDPSVIQLFPTSLAQYEFVTGPASLKVVGMKEGETKVSFNYLGKEYAHISITVSSNEEEIQTLLAKQDPSEVETQLGFSDLTKEHRYYNAITHLQSLGVIDGYPDGSFQPEKPVSRVEALKLILSISENPLKADVALRFPDTQSTEWYAPYVATGEELGVVQGYPDGLFRPAQDVNRVEFAKILLKALNIDVDPVVEENPYEDVHYLEWFAPYAQFIKQTNISPWSEKLEPSTPMSRGEVAEMIYRILMIQENDAMVYSAEVAS